MTTIEYLQYAKSGAGKRWVPNQKEERRKAALSDALAAAAERGRRAFMRWVLGAGDPPSKGAS